MQLRIFSDQFGGHPAPLMRRKFFLSESRASRYVNRVLPSLHRSCRIALVNVTRLFPLSTSIHHIFKLR